MMKYFRKIIGIFNIPAHFKTIFLKRKLNKYKGENSVWKIILKFIFSICILLVIGYVNYVYRDLKVQIGSIIFVLFFIYFLGVRKKKKVEKIEKSKSKNDREITEIMLKDQDENIIQSWYIYDYSSILIGKKTKSNMVDIDLSESTYAPLISREHAVMNRTSKGWYFEDVGSSNGSGIKSGRTGEKKKIGVDKPYKIYSGDTIYIANTKLLVK